jgi:hypothetical protein
MSDTYNSKTFAEKLRAACAERLHRAEVHIESLDMTFYLQGLNAGRADFWQTRAIQNEENPKWGSATQLMLALSLVDAAGNWLFKSHDFVAQRALEDLPTDVRDELADKALELTGMSTGNREAMEKKSETTQD